MKQGYIDLRKISQDHPLKPCLIRVLG